MVSRLLDAESGRQSFSRRTESPQSLPSLAWFRLALTYYLTSKRQFPLCLNHAVPVARRTYPGLSKCQRKEPADAGRIVLRLGLASKLPHPKPLLLAALKPATKGNKADCYPLTNSNTQPESLVFCAMLPWRNHKMPIPWCPI